jgi:hypothetical protein
MARIHRIPTFRSVIWKGTWRWKRVAPVPNHGGQRRQEVDGPVGRDRHDPFLEEELDPVGEGDQDPRRAGPVGAHANLHVGHDLPLQPDHHHHRHQQGEEDHDDPGDQQDPGHPVDAR